MVHRLQGQKFSEAPRAQHEDWIRKLEQGQRRRPESKSSATSHSSSSNMLRNQKLSDLNPKAQRQVTSLELQIKNLNPKAQRLVLKPAQKML